MLVGVPRDSGNAASAFRTSEGRGLTSLLAIAEMSPFGEDGAPERVSDQVFDEVFETLATVGEDHQ